MTRGTHLSAWWRIAVVAFVLGAALTVARAQQAARYPTVGLVLSVDASHQTFTASIDRIPGVMEAMSMPFRVRDARDLAGVVPGAFIDFTLVVGADASYAESLHVRRTGSLEQDPLIARRLSVMRQVASGRAPNAIAVGAHVPNFHLIDQQSRPVTLSAFAGKVVAINFMYTTCQLPDFCLRIVNHFGALQKRFAVDLGRDLIFLTMSFDPIRDQPDVLARYAAQWSPNPNTWHFLTGQPDEVERALEAFGVAAFPDEGLMDHSLHTVIINRDGTLAANVEGNQYTADQLGDLIDCVLDADATH
jgi:protein SCO1/2